jgi:hypothetical protein
LDNLARRSHEVKVTASDFGSGSSWAASVCDDDGTATVWESAASTGSKWLELEWMHPRNISHVEFQETSEALGSYVIKSYNPDTTSWTTLFNGTLDAATTYGGAISSSLSKKVRIEFNLSSATSLIVPVVNIYTATEGLPCADGTTYLTTGMYKHDNLAYHSNDVIEIVNVSYNASCSPRSWLDGTLTLKTSAPISSNYAIAMEVTSPIYDILPLRWQILNWRYEDPRTAAKIIWPSTPTSNWAVNTQYTIPFSVFIDRFAPNGNNTISLFFYDDNAKMAKIKQNGNTWSGAAGIGTRDLDRQYAIGTINISRHTVTPVSNISIAVESNGDAPGLKINNQWVPPVINVADYADYEILDEYQSTQLSNQQIHIYRISSLGYTVTSDSIQESLTNSNIDQIERKIAQILRIDPNAYFIITPVMRVESYWLTENPNECAVDANGETADYNSLHSNVWKQDSVNVISNIVAALENGNYRNRIVGYAFFAGEGGEFRPSVDLLSGYVERASAKLGDFSSAAVTSFTNWLKNKYTDDISIIRTAWGNSNVTWDTVMPTKAQLTAAPAALGWFFSPGSIYGEQQVIDYFLWTADDISSDVIAFCGAVKSTTTTGALAGAYYGYRHVANQTPGTFQAIGHAYLHKAVESENVDFISLPYSYCARSVTRPYANYSIPGSLLARNKLFFSELDQRTSAVYPSVYSQSSLSLSREIMRRDFGHNLCAGSGLWWKPFDHGRVSVLTQNKESIRWYKHFDLLDFMYDSRTLYQTQYNRGFTKTSEIAVIVDYESILYTDIYASIPHYNSSVRMLEEEIPKIGAPYDIYSMNDLDLDCVKNNYKMYIFINTHYVDAGKASTIINNYQKDGKTLVWMWAPGYLHETGPSTYNMQILTGLTFGGVTGSTKWLTAPTISTTSSALTTAFNGSFSLNNWHTNSYAISLYADKIKLNPVFWVTSTGCTVGGTWDASGHSADGNNALVFKDLGTWKTAFSAIPFIPHTILRNIAKLAGVHIYTEAEDITYQGNDDFAVIYNCSSSTKSPISIILPASKKIYNATGSVLFGGIPQTTFNIGLLAGHTAILRYDNP